MHAVERKLSDLNVDVEDVALYIGEYEDKLVEVHLDYFGRQTLRDLYIFMEYDTIYCDLVKNTVTYLKQDKQLAFDEARDDYQIAELEHFFDIVAGKIENDNSAMEAESLMRILEAGRYFACAYQTPGVANEAVALIFYPQYPADMVYCMNTNASRELFFK